MLSLQEILPTAGYHTWHKVGCSEFQRFRIALFISCIFNTSCKEAIDSIRDKLHITCTRRSLLVECTYMECVTDLLFPSTGSWRLVGLKPKLAWLTTWLYTSFIVSKCCPYPIVLSFWNPQFEIKVDVFEHSRVDMVMYFHSPIA